MDGASEPMVLCCLLWAHPGREAALAAYEDRVLRFMPDHGGAVLNRVSADGADGRPNEVQLLRFSGGQGLDAYLADPRRLALAPERDRVVARSEVFPVEPIE